MNLLNSFPEAITDSSNFDFDTYASEVFNYQSNQNPHFREYLSNFQSKYTDYRRAPFLPIEFFKNFQIKTGQWDTETIFRSSGTTGMRNAEHHVKSIADYHIVVRKIFNYFFTDIQEYNFLALLPSYLERGDSSLVEMVNGFISRSPGSIHGFFLNNFDELNKALVRSSESGRKTLLIGVSFALLDFARQYSGNNPELTVMETGGMKGRRKELTREELHLELSKNFQIKSVMSEYGMTELLSQAYAYERGYFRCPPWMKVIVREINDPLSECDFGETGLINIIDLANLHTCSFIETSDLGKLHQDGTFEVLGRLDNSEIRGCNLMVI